MHTSGARDATRPITVLVVDDDEDDLVILRHHLGSMGTLAASIVTCTTAQAALQHLEEGTFDVVLLDYHLNGTTGVELFGCMQRAGRDLPTILLTDHGGEDVAVSALHAGLSDYMPKDVVTPKSLERSVANALEKYALRRSIADHQQNLERMVTELRARNHEILSFYHSLSHELKTPLTAIREFVSIVLEEIQGPVTEAQRDSLETAKGACDQMVTCINDILDISRVETGKLSLQGSVQPLAPLLQRAVSYNVARAAEKGVTISWNMEDDDLAAWFDDQRLQQVLSNLIGNAIKFTDSGGRIDVEARRRKDGTSPGCVDVLVRDTGCGIEPDKIDRIFDRLYQASDEDAALRGGLGLGLSLCRELVRLHGGDLLVTSTLGEGSTFSFDLGTTAPENTVLQTTTP